MYHYWTFGDGSSSVSQDPTHTYNEPGNYIAVLTVRDNAGAKTCASVNIAATGQNGDISPPAPPAGLMVFPGSL
jgi:PKD repeat protein